MAYNKTVWKDQDVENPRTYTQRKNDDGSVTLLDHFGTITELGTPVNAENMNKIEDGIAAAVEKSSISQDLTNPSADTIPSTKAVADESSRIESVMDTKLAKKLNVNARTVGEITDLRTPLLNEGNTSTIYIDGYMINSEDDINGCLVAPELNANGRISNRLLARKRINGNNIYRGLIIGINADGSAYTELDRSSNDNSIVTTVCHGSNYGSSYVRFGNGVQICWGNSPDNQTITLPQAFKNNAYRVAFCQTDSSAHTYNNTAVEKTTTSFKFINGYQGDWIATGWWY